MRGSPVNRSKIATRPKLGATSSLVALTIPVLALTIACTPNDRPSDTAAAPPPEASSTDPDQAVDAALTQRLGLDARLAVRRRNALENWIFECGKPVSPGGAPVDYRATTLHEQAVEGIVDDNACVLVEQVDHEYIVRELSVGDTDAPFVDWPQRHGLPDAILGEDG